MGQKKGGSPITHRISLSQKEDLQIRKRAACAGMSITSFIKREALSGSIKVLEFPSLVQHTAAIGAIVQDILSLLFSSHPDRWLYQADLEHIEDQLDALLEIETDIQEHIRHRIK